MEYEDNALPVSAPVKFTCTGCRPRRGLLTEKVGADAGCFAEQINLARHIAAEHPGEVPAPHDDDCPLCPKFAKLPDDAGCRPSTGPGTSSSRRTWPGCCRALCTSRGEPQDERPNADWVQAIRQTFPGVRASPHTGLSARGGEHGFPFSHGKQCTVPGLCTITHAGYRCGAHTDQARHPSRHH